jgi:uncharacterized protein YbjT (DUF2867 family)
MRIAVAGGTGVVGQHVVAAAAAAGHEPVVLARSRGVDVTTGRGLHAALAGAEALIDVSNVVTSSRRRSVAFFTAATEHLLAAGQEAGVQHYVALSIVGIDRVDFGYYEGKRVQEDLVLSGPLPASVLRATQFHEFAGQVLARVPGPVALVPRMRTQPVAAREVATALVALATSPAVGRAPELAGPDVHDLIDLARQVAKVSGQRRPVVPVRMPGATGRAMATGALLPTGPGPRGTRSFASWLTETGGEGGTDAAHTDGR